MGNYVMSKSHKLIGKRFGRLVVMYKTNQRKNGFIVLQCMCDCGNIHHVRSSALTRKDGKSTKSCGCIQKETAGRHIKHGRSGSPEYASYTQMRRRCLNPNHKDYPRYGGRGITICDRWLDSFENFYADMGKRPSLKFSLDRKNNDLGYSPSNTKWSTPYEQQNNRSSNHKIPYNGRTQNICQWADELNIKRRTLRSRISQLNWSIEKALTTPVRQQKGKQL